MNPPSEPESPRLRALPRATAGALRLVLVNLCETTYGYGPGAAEYLRAHLLTVPALAGRVEVEILFVEDEHADEVARRIAALSPDLVGFTCYSWNLAASGHAARALRHIEPDLPIVWGGCSFGFFRERHDWFTWWDCVDAVAIGAGEYTLAGLMRHGLEHGLSRTLPALAGLALHRDGGVTFGPPTRAPLTLDELASPYLLGTAQPVARPFIEVARGCRLQCAFCSDARGARQGAFITRSGERLAGEVAAVTAWPCAEWIDAGASTANITDELFVRTCDSIRRGDPGQRLRYSFQMHPGLVTPVQREALQGVRIGKVCMGLQSTSPQTFRAMRRKGDLGELERAVRLLAGVGPLYVTLILGLPGETLASFRETVEALRLLEDVQVSVHRFLVLPGTELHLKEAAYGLRYDPTRYYRVTASNTMSADDLRRAQDFVLELAARERLSPHGHPRLDWTNFDHQGRAFDAPAHPEKGKRTQGAANQ